jgi:hypothetical protein
MQPFPKAILGRQLVSSRGPGKQEKLKAGKKIKLHARMREYLTSVKKVKGAKKKVK